MKLMLKTTLRTTLRTTLFKLNKELCL